MVDFERMATALGTDLGNWSVAEAAAALRYYSEGNSAQLAARETGIPIRRIDRWIEASGLKRTKAQTSQVRSAKAHEQWHGVSGQTMCGHLGRSHADIKKSD